MVFVGDLHLNLTADQAWAWRVSKIMSAARRTVIAGDLTGQGD
jgi:hypothetical protein